MQTKKAVKSIEICKKKKVVDILWAVEEKPGSVADSSSVPPAVPPGSAAPDLIEF